MYSFEYVCRKFIKYYGIWSDADKILFFVFALSGQTTKMVKIFQVLPYAYGIIS